ncbi:MAG: SBBP repeat-containing protein [Pseudomonadota bacterium]
MPSAQIRFVLKVVVVFTFGLLVGCSSSSSPIADLGNDIGVVQQDSAIVDSKPDVNTEVNSDTNVTLDTSTEQGATCNDECTTQGEQVCDQAKTGYRVCDNYDSDSCLEWGGAVTCGAGQICKSGACCTPNCGGRICGPDPTCAATCGTCTSGKVCDAKGQCVVSTSWILSAGGSSYDYGYSIAIDASNNAYVTGYFENQANFGTPRLTSKGYKDIFIAKVLPSGQFDWAVSAGGSSDESGNSIAIDTSGNAYVTGVFWDETTFGSTTLTSKGWQDIFIAKVLPSGQFDWAVSAGWSDYDYAYGITVDSSSNAYITGNYSYHATFGSTTLTSNGKDDIFIAKILPSGQFAWALSAGGSMFDNGCSIAIDTNDNAYVTGYFWGQAAFGSTTLTSQGDYDMFVAKVLPSGQFDWAVSASGGGWVIGEGIATDTSNNAYVTGYFWGQAIFGSTTLTSNGVEDIFVAKVLPSGQFDWAVSAGGLNMDYGRGIAIDTSDNAYVTGEFRGQAIFGSTTLTSNGVEDIFVAKVLPSGQFDWAVSAGGSKVDVGRSIAIDTSNNAYVTGMFSDQTTFDSTTLTSKGISDVFIWKNPLP